MDKNRLLEFYTQFNKIQNQFTAVRRSMIATDCDEPIYASEMQVLALMRMHPEYTVSDIAHTLYITPSAASQLVKKLCKKGYLHKYRNPDNERVALINLTEQGNKAVDAFLSNESYSLGVIVSRFEDLNDEQFDTIKLFLDTLEEVFDKKLQ